MLAITQEALHNTGAAEGGADLSAWARGLVQSGKDHTQQVLGLLGTAFSMLVHQVAMHCFERAGFMASLWNMLTALLGATQSLDGEVQPANPFLSPLPISKLVICHTPIPLWKNQ